LRSLRSKKSDQYHHGDLRNALLTAARELLEEGGPSSLGLREIARRVGVSAPSAYHYFSSLDAIAVGLAEQGTNEMAECLAVEASHKASQLAQTGEAYIAFARANPALYRLMFGEGFSATSKGGVAVRDLRQMAFDIIKARLAERLPEGDLAIAGLFLWSLVHGLSLLVIDGQIEKKGDTDEVIRRVLELAGNGLAVPRMGARRRV
jgi:AcrR family transcriptional regulator